ncbi:MAG: GNAT family N-acetyltransferase [Actinocatenispora sp.]
MSDGIRPLVPEDLPDCLDLAQDRAWSREEHKWRFLFELGTVYGQRDATGRLVGTTILTRYGPDVAAISMVLVATSHGRRGLGRALMEHALAEAGEAVVFLNATEYGRPLYERLGFRAVGGTVVHVGHFDIRPSSDPVSRPFRAADLPAVRALDAEVVGADRTRLVRRLPDFAEQVRVIERHGTITGYAGAWRNVDNVLVGPVVAATADDARTLIADTAARVDGPVRLDLDDRHPELREWATRHGVPVRGRTDVMVRGADELPGDRDRWFVPVMQALG